MLNCNMTLEMTYINFINYLDIQNVRIHCLVILIYNWLSVEIIKKGVHIFHGLTVNKHYILYIVTSAINHPSTLRGSACIIK